MPLLETSQPSKTTSVASSILHITYEPPVLFPEKIVTKQGADVLLQDINNEKFSSSFHTYGHSKLANILFTYKVARYLNINHKKIYVNCVNPGLVRTNLGKIFV
eukprot:snap_masked-scaffold_6-processed-gene-5.26-mRNA-1 protein AED:0.21 eAED:0.32 QI:0/-1/0/1/-1/1/1/0/103